MADRPEASDVPLTERDAYGAITTKTKDLRPYNQAKERQLEMNRLLAFFKAMERCWPFCPVCGNHNIEWKWPCR